MDSGWCIVSSFHGVFPAFPSTLLPLCPPPLPGDFLATSLSLFGGGLLGLLDLDLPPDFVCAVKASASHEGNFLSTAEDSNNR